MWWLSLPDKNNFAVTNQRCLKLRGYAQGGPFFVSFTEIRPPQAHLPLSAELIGVHSDFIKFHLTFKLLSQSNLPWPSIKRKFLWLLASSCNLSKSISQFNLSIPKTNIFQKSIPLRPLFWATFSGINSTNTLNALSLVSLSHYIFWMPMSSFVISSLDFKSNSMSLMPISSNFICSSITFLIKFLRISTTFQSEIYIKELYAEYIIQNYVQ